MLIHPTPGLEPDQFPQSDWKRLVDLLLLSRRLDEVEETELAPAKEIFYQFSARGHDMAQIMLGLRIDDPNDAVSGYYRSRPMLLPLGVAPEEMLRSALGREGGYSSGRDIGVVFNRMSDTQPHVLPMAGGVGAQFTPALGYAQAIKYYRDTLGDTGYDSAIAVAAGGDGSVASNGFWSALTGATTLEVPLLFYIEDNGYAISVPSSLQVPDGDISTNLSGWHGLEIFSGSGSDPLEAQQLTAGAVAHVRESRAPALLHLRVPRLQGHSLQDTQAYKATDLLERERADDPLARLRALLEGSILSTRDWAAAETRARNLVDEALEIARAAPLPDTSSLLAHVYGTAEKPLRKVSPSQADGPRINMADAVRRTLEQELSDNERIVVFGEDVGQKGGIHGVTVGLQERFGAERVFDTHLSEEGIVGRAVGMALAGLMPVPEIQFRKYADPAMEQINDCGTLRWRTCNRASAPMVLRMPVGFSRCGDPWHSQTNEVAFVHNPGWKVAVPSNASDAAGLLRTALRGCDPVVFFEHRMLLDNAHARRSWDGPDHVVPFGSAAMIASGDDLTIVTWGAMVQRCEIASEGRSVDVIDLRTLAPWDTQTVVASVRNTHRCLIVHEDLRAAGFGAEIAAAISEAAFLDIDAPVTRVTMPDVPSPHSPILLNEAVPSVERIRQAIDDLIGF
ncbi:MAG: transketolase C-terminal domain-containing protein [Pseudomonadota bacterium]